MLAHATLMTLRFFFSFLQRWSVTKFLKWASMFLRMYTVVELSVVEKLSPFLHYILLQTKLVYYYRNKSTLTKTVLETLWILCFGVFYGTYGKSALRKLKLRSIDVSSLRVAAHL